MAYLDDHQKFAMLQHYWGAHCAHASFRGRWHFSASREGDVLEALIPLESSGEQEELRGGSEGEELSVSLNALPQAGHAWCPSSRRCGNTAHEACSGLACTGTLLILIPKHVPF